MKQPVLMLELWDYVEILRRRKWIIVICLALGLAVAGVVFVVVPKVYRSSTLIMVESQKVPADFIKAVMVDTIEERLLSIQQQIFSRTILQKIMDEHRLYKDELQRKTVEEVIEMMRKDIQVKTVDDRSRRNILAFTISYEGENATTVMQVTNKLASLFIEENLKTREQMVEGTAEFLDQEMRVAKEKLERQETALGEFKKRFQGQLPQQVEANLRTLDRLQTDLQNLTDTLRMGEEKRVILEEAIKNPAGETPFAFSSNAPESPLSVRLSQLRAQLSQLKSEYKEDYPDVIQTRRQIRELEAQMAGGDSQSAPAQEGGKEQDMPAAGDSGEPASGEKPRAANRALDAQLKALDAELAFRQKKKAALVKQIQALEGRIERVPVHEQELHAILREVENQRRNYETLLSKKMTASISESLEKRQKGERFRIIDPANLPEKPAKPDPVKVFVGGAVGGLALAGGLIWWGDFRNVPFRRPEEVEAVLGLPTLATIPFADSLVADDAAGDNARAAPKKGRWARWRARLKAWPKRLPSWRPWAGKTASRARNRQAAKARVSALASEQFRVLAGRVLQLREKKGVRVLAITSSLAGEGKTALATELAVTLARDYREHTVLIDGDLRHPSVGARLGLPDGKGLVSVLAGAADLDSVLRRHAEQNLLVLPAGRGDSSRLGMPAARGAMQKLFDELKQRGVFVLLDAPPILPIADMNLYSEIVDAMVLVVRVGQTPQHVVAHALDFLAGGKMEGVVLNGLTNLHWTYYSEYESARYVVAEAPAEPRGRTGIRENVGKAE